MDLTLHLNHMLKNDLTDVQRDANHWSTTHTKKRVKILQLQIEAGVNLRMPAVDVVLNIIEGLGDWNGSQVK